MIVTVVWGLPYSGAPRAHPAQRSLLFAESVKWHLLGVRDELWSLYLKGVPLSAVGLQGWSIRLPFCGWSSGAVAPLHLRALPGCPARWPPEPGLTGAFRACGQSAHAAHGSRLL